MQDIVVSMDDELKLSFEEVCADIGISIPSAILIFARRVARDRKIPFELTASLSSPIRFIQKAIWHICAAESRIIMQGNSSSMT